jgi:putative toxin-antitoxin system antitoxin component (TIGR02293 family)
MEAKYGPERWKTGQMTVNLGQKAVMAEKKSGSKKPGYTGGSKASKVKEPYAQYNQAAVRTLEFLGGRGAVLSGTVVKEEKDLITLIKKGIPRKSIDLLMLETGLTATEMAALMHTSDRTLRRYKPSSLLNPEQSERLIEIARLYSRGEDVFGNKESFKQWMESDLLAFDQHKPKEFLDTSMGIEMIMDELGRIEQGVFA